MDSWVEEVSSVDSDSNPSCREMLADSSQCSTLFDAKIVDGNPIFLFIQPLNVDVHQYT